MANSHYIPSVCVHLANYMCLGNNAGMENNRSAWTTSWHLVLVKKMSHLIFNKHVSSAKSATQIPVITTFQLWLVHNRFELQSSLSHSAAYNRKSPTHDACVQLKFWPSVKIAVNYFVQHIIMSVGAGKCEQEMQQGGRKADHLETCCIVLLQL